MFRREYFTTKLAMLTRYAMDRVRYCFQHNTNDVVSGEPNMNANLIATLAMSFASGAAVAGNWTQVDATAEETVLMDASSIKVSGDEVEVKVMRTYAGTQLNLLGGEWYAFRSQVATFSVQCTQGKLGYVSWVLYHGTKGKGRAVHEGRVTGVLAGDVPATQGEKALVAQVCKSDVAMSLQPAQIVAEVNQ
jgi:hypothetical protein